jgi:predicted esterase
MGGNFKAYLWVLAKIADRRRIIVVAPSGGAGRWDIAETNTRVRAALAMAQSVVAIDSTQVHAIGLSNGGRAVSDLLVADRRVCRSFVFLSPVFREESVRRFEVSSPHREKSAVLIITGALDRRVPEAYVKSNAQALADAGANLSLEILEDADHFLIFTHRERMASLLENWLATVR